MRRARKVKISVTLSEDLLDRIDREAQKDAQFTRSSVMEAWLRQAARRKTKEALDEATIAYYAGLSDQDRAEDAEWAKLGARTLRKID